jgi:hypothetical protein
MRVSKGNINKIEFISINNSKAADTRPLLQLIDLTATNCYADKKLFLFGRNDLMCTMNRNDLICHKKKISNWIQCQKSKSSHSFTESQLNIILLTIIALLLFITIVAIAIAVLIGVCGKKKKKTKQKTRKYVPLRPRSRSGTEKRKSVVLNLETTETENKYSSSSSFIYSGFQHNKPIPTKSSDTYASAFEDNKASESEIFKQRPVDLAVKSKMKKDSSLDKSLNKEKTKSKSGGSPKKSSPQKVELDCNLVKTNAKGSPNLLTTAVSESELNVGRPTELRVKSRK